MTTFKDHFSERAAGYASYRPHYPAALADWLASISPARDLAWDAGCGSGQPSTLLGDRFARVIATDASEAQIAQAARHPNVEYRVEPAERSSLRNESVNLTTVAQAAHWMDLTAFYDEVHRVSARGAAVALVAYHIAIIDQSVDRVVDDFYSRTLDGYWPPDRKHIETGYRDLPFPFERVDPPTFDMRVSWTVEQMIGYIRTWSAVRAMEKAKGPDATERFAESLREAWGSIAREVRWPVIVLAGRVS